MINELINGPKLAGAAAVACSDLLGDKSYKFINRLRNNIAWILLLPIFCLQTCKSAGQDCKPLGIFENITHTFDLGAERWKLGIIRNDGRVRFESGNSRGAVWCRNLSVPSAQKALKCTFATSPVTNPGEPVSKQAATKGADKSENGVCDWATHIMFFVVCFWLFIWIGYYGALLPPNEKS